MESAKKSPLRLGLLTAVLLAAGLLDIFGIWHGDSPNVYYAAAVQSMQRSFRNFFYLAFDPSGFVSVDKPPVALWMQALSVRIFGLHNWSLILPQALASVAAAAVLYRAVKRVFGFAAGLLAAAALSVTPVFVALARSSNVDSILLLVMTLAASQLLRAVETGRIRHLFAAMALAGLGYNVKMLAAFMILPAFFITWLWAAKGPLPVRLRRMLAATLVLAAVSLSWSLAVDLTPAAARPYVGSSKNNSEIGLALGYNGLNRVLPGLFHSSAARKTTETASGTSSTRLAEVGNPSPLRLLNRQLGSQISWFLPVALIGGAAALWSLRRRRDARFFHLVFWWSALIPMWVYYDFSTGYIHRYYLGMLAPCLAALTGIGLSWLWRLYRRGGRGGWLLPAALAATACLQAGLMVPFFHWSRILIETVAVLGAFAAAGLTALRRMGRAGTAAAVVCALGVAGIFGPPAAWSASALIYHESGASPMAGPLTTEAAAPVGQSILRALRADLSPARSDSPAGGKGQKLTAYLLRHRGGSRYLAATDTADDAEYIILETGQPVIATGGFSGNDPILTLTGFRRMVASHQVRYFVVQIYSGRHSYSALAKWAMAYGKAVPGSDYGSSAGSLTQSRQVVYDLSRAA